MSSELICFSERCRAQYPITEPIYNCPRCGSLLEASYSGARTPAHLLKTLWRGRRTSNAPLDQSGVWRYREMIPFLDNYNSVVTLREGNTPLLPALKAAQFGGLDFLTFKHQGFNPTGSFKDNGMTCGASQAVRLGMKRVACVSTGNTSASMAAYSSAGGLQPIIFIPHGNISYGKLAQALEYGAKTFQVEANFDQILALVRTLADKLGIYLLNSVNPFRIEGQKTIIIEMMDQRDWNPPTGSCCRAAIWEHVGIRKGLARAVRVGPDRESAAPGRHSSRWLGAILRLNASRRSLLAARRGSSRNAGHGDQDRRSGVLAESSARSGRLGRRGGEGDRAGDRRREGDYRAVRHWL
jgi:hypothetical protein